jgi:uncharacterized protein YlxW (UPF0749 family)
MPPLDIDYIPVTTSNNTFNNTTSFPEFTFSSDSDLTNKVKEMAEIIKTLQAEVKELKKHVQIESKAPENRNNLLENIY